MMKYFKFWQDMSILDQWVLDEPVTADGEMIYGWNFTMGIPYVGPAPVACKPYQEGREIPVAFGGLDTPYLRKDIAQAIVNIDPDGVQVFPVAVAGAVGEYWIVNPIRVIDAIHPSSDIEDYSDEQKARDPELALRYKSVWNLVLDAKKIPTDAHIFMLKKHLTHMYVSEKLMNAIIRVCPEHGGKFTEIELAAV